MNMDPMTVIPDQISVEQNLPIENPQRQSSKQIPMAKKGPMQPTPLEYSWWSTHPSERKVGTFVLFIIITIVVGVMIVCLTQPPPAGKNCRFVLKSTVRNLLSDDSRPHSVVIADFNNDALLDIVVPNSGMNNIGVFLRDDNGTFTDQMIYSTGTDSTPYGVAVSDFNHDQQLDIAVANFDSHTIGIFLGLGNGTFKPQTIFSTGSSRPRSIAVGDFNNDTRHDIAVVNYGTYTLGIFLQDTNGSFANQTTFSTEYDSDPYSLVVGDLNNDDKLDIVVANYGTNNVGVFVGHGDGSFAIEIIVSTGIHSHPYSIAIGHLNNDTYLDIVVANSGSDNVGVLLGYGNDTFAIPTMYSTGDNSLPCSVAIADLDNDNKLDIAVANYGNDSVIVLLGDGNGSFSDRDQDQPFFNSSNLNPYSIGIGDFNNDSRLDIVVVNYDFNHVDIILNKRNFSFHNQTTYLTDDSKPESIVIANLDNDNYGDIIVANSRQDNIMIVLGKSDSTFSSKTFYSTAPYSSPCSVAVSDFSDDGTLDIVFVSYETHNIGVLLGYGDGSFWYGSTFSTGNGSNPIAIAIGDFNSDYQPDIVVANSGADNIGVFLGYGDGTFFSQVIYSTGFSSQPHSVAIGDFNNDSRLDIVVANIDTNNVGIFLGHGDGTFSNQITYSTANHSGPSLVVVGDFNNDSQSDIIVANYLTGTLSLFLGYGNGVLSSEIILSTDVNSGPWSITTGDFNNDRRLDVAAVNRWSDNLGIFVGYGNGSFSNQTTYSTGSGSSPWSVAVGDLNNDGHADIAVADRDTNNIGIFMGYVDGNFTTQETMSTTIASNPISVAVGDFNNDDRLDIVVANYRMGNVGIFLGDGYGTFSSQVTYDTGYASAPFSVAVGDFNNDSQLDIVAVNRWAYNISVFLGYGDGSFSNQTTFSTGDNSYPTAVAVGDFNNDDRLDIVVANYQTGNFGVFLGFGNGIFASQVTFSTGSGSSPCSIAVGDFNNDSRLDIVVTNYVFASVGVFLGYGNGTFSSQTNYSTTRNSDPTNVVVGDLNNDGRLDIVVALNSDAAIVVFLGNGNGTFSRQLIQPTGSQSFPCVCALGDMNNDHQLDVIVIDVNNRRLVVLLGDGYGSFSNTRTYSTGASSNPQSVAFGDFNNDGILDIVLTNSDANTIGVFLGYSYINGKRESICSTGSAPHPRAIALADFNKDTQLDMVITNYGLDNLEILLQDTNKTFSIQMMFSTGALSLPTSVAVGDLNSDKQLDITVANSGSGNIDVLYGYGNGSFTNQTTFSPELNFIPQSVAVGDFNSDKKLDIVVADSGTNSVMTLLRYDPGAFGNKTMYSTGTDSQPMRVTVGDLNNDGWLDFAVANGESDNVGVFLGLGNGTFSSQTTYSTGNGSYPWGIAVADLNKDSQLDIIVCNYLSDSIGIFLGFGNGTFSDQITYPTGYHSGPFGIATGDLNKDDQLDIVVANYNSSNIGIFLTNDDGTFFSIISYSTGDNSKSCSVAVGDLNDDNRLDIVVANINGSNVGVFIGYGDGTFSTMISYLTSSHSAPISVAVSDFNNDGRLDIAVANAHTDNIGVLFGDGNGTFSNQWTYSTGSGSSPYFLAIGDFNNDNQLDIAIANKGSNSFSVLLGCDNGTFFSPLNYFIADSSQPFSIAVGDFNNDQRLDIVVTSTFTDHVAVFLGYASECFLFAPSTSTGSLSQPSSIAVGDFDHDTRLDVFVANNGADNVMVLFGSGFGTFVNPTIYSTGNDSKPCWVAVGDFNNDSRLDIVVANSGTNNVGIFLSNGSGTFLTQMIYSTGVDSQPYSVAVLDLDNDTRLDVAVANYGSDSVLVLFGDGNGSFPKQLIFDTGFASHPFALAVGDVNNDNLSDIVGTNDGYGNMDIISEEC